MLGLEFLIIEKSIDCITHKMKIKIFCLSFSLSSTLYIEKENEAFLVVNMGKMIVSSNGV